MAESKMILVIDDEEAVREAVADILEMIEVPVMLAASGQIGIDTYCEHKSQIGGVLLDMKMPGLSGPETLRELRKINTKVYVIMSTGYSEQDAHRSMGHDQPDDFLSKPYRIEKLISKIQRALEE